MKPASPIERFLNWLNKTNTAALQKQYEEETQKDSIFVIPQYHGGKIFGIVIRTIDARGTHSAKKTQIGPQVITKKIKGTQEGEFELTFEAGIFSMNGSGEGSFLTSGRPTPRQFLTYVREQYGEYSSENQQATLFKKGGIRKAYEEGYKLRNGIRLLLEASHETMLEKAQRAEELVAIGITGKSLHQNRLFLTNDIVVEGFHAELTLGKTQRFKDLERGISHLKSQETITKYIKAKVDGVVQLYRAAGDLEDRNTSERVEVLNEQTRMKVQAILKNEESAVPQMIENNPVPPTPQTKNRLVLAGPRE